VGCLLPPNFIDRVDGSEVILRESYVRIAAKSTFIKKRLAPDIYNVRRKSFFVF